MFDAIDAAKCDIKMSPRHVSLQRKLFTIILYWQLATYAAEALKCYKCSDYIKGPCFQPKGGYVAIEFCKLTDVPTEPENEAARKFVCFHRKLYYHDKGAAIHRGCVDDANFCEHNNTTRRSTDDADELESFSECGVCETDLCNSVPERKLAGDVPICFLCIILFNWFTFE